MDFKWFMVKILRSAPSTPSPPTQRYVESLLLNRKNITNLGELLIPLNVKYVLLTKEVDYKEYLFLLNQTDLELIKETGNFFVFKNKHPVSRFYLSQSPKADPLTFTPIPYTQHSPVKFTANASSGYLIFIPPNLDSDYWELNGAPSLAQGFYAVYHAAEGEVYYRRFDTYLIGYIVSLVTLICLGVWYKKEWLLEKWSMVRRASG